MARRSYRPGRKFGSRDSKAHFFVQNSGRRRMQWVVFPSVFAAIGSAKWELLRFLSRQATRTPWCEIDLSVDFSDSSVERGCVAGSAISSRRRVAKDRFPVDDSGFVNLCTLSVLSAGRRLRGAGGVSAGGGNRRSPWNHADFVPRGIIFSRKMPSTASRCSGGTYATTR